jgi:hypothetical protein
MEVFLSRREFIMVLLVKVIIQSPWRIISGSPEALTISGFTWIGLWLSDASAYLYV